MENVPKISELTYRCKHCGFLCTKKTVPELTRIKTKTGNYGTNGTPTPTVFYDEQYTATTLSFVASTGDTSAKINDSANKFADKNFRSEQPIKIETTSGTNDGTYTIAARGVSRGTLTLCDDDSLTTENAATAGEVTISDVTYEPSITTGCPMCGSLNSK